MCYVKECVRDVVRIGGRQGRAEFLRLDMNENPEGLPEEFVNRIKEELTPEFFSTYPEPEKFLKILADYLGVQRENVCVTNGSDMAIRYLFEVENLDFLICGHFERNARSRRVIEKCGFRYSRTVPFMTEYGTEDQSMEYILFHPKHANA